MDFIENEKWIMFPGSKLDRDTQAVKECEDAKGLAIVEQAKRRREVGWLGKRVRKKEALYRCFLDWQEQGTQDHAF
jgi:hypothetical protein